MAELEKKRKRLVDAAERREMAYGFSGSRDVPRHLLEYLTEPSTKDDSTQPQRPISGFWQKLALAMKTVPLQIGFGISISTLP